MATVDNRSIDLREFRGDRSSVFTGRPQGEDARAKLCLDELDKDEKAEVKLTIPSGTTSFNPSFYLGLLYDSIKKLGAEKFKRKYKIEVQDTDLDTKRVLQSNLEDGLRNAINSIKGNNNQWLSW